MWSNKQNSRKYYLSSKTSNITLWLLQPTLGLKNLKSIQTARSFLNLILTCQPIPLDRVYFFHSCIPNNWPVSPPINLFYPPFTSIYLDLPQFTPIYLNLPQFTLIDLNLQPMLSDSVYYLSCIYLALVFILGLAANTTVAIIFYKSKKVSWDSVFV